MFGFAFIFAAINRVPSAVKTVFHGFGGLSAALSGLFMYLSLEAESCMNTTTVLWYYVYISSIVGLICGAFVLAMSPFWFIEFWYPHTILDKEKRRGSCYPVYRVAPFIWHV